MTASETSEKTEEFLSNKEVFTVIDEKPELTTMVQNTNLQEKSKIGTKVLSKISKGYTFYTVIIIISYILNTSSYILPYCLREMGIIPFIVLLLILFLSSFYIFYLIIDVMMKNPTIKSINKLIEISATKKFNYIYNILNILYHFLILIFHIYYFLLLATQLLSYIGIQINNNLRKFAVLIVSFFVVQFPFSFLSRFKRPDASFILVSIVLIFISIVFLIVKNYSKSKEFLNINLYKSFSNEYFTCFSIVAIMIGWQSEIYKNFDGFKIKTSKRYNHVVRLSFIILFFLIGLISFSCLPVIAQDEKDKNNMFILYYPNIDKQNKLQLILTIKIVMGIIAFFIQISISYRIHLIKDFANYILNYKNEEDNSGNWLDMSINISLTFTVLILGNFLALLIKDVSFIIIIAGGILSSIINNFYPTLIYSSIISKHSFATYCGWLISFTNLIIGTVGLFMKILSKE